SRARGSPSNVATRSWPHSSSAPSSRRPRIRSTRRWSPSRCISCSSLACSSHASPELFQPRFQLRLCAQVGRHVIPPSLERVWEVRLVRGDMAFEVVRVLVTLTVSLLGHESGGRVPKMKGHRVHPRLGEVVLKLPEAALQRVRLRREREVHRGLSERVVRL